MFCNESKQREKNTMSCGEIWLQEIVTFISLICTLFVLIISFINLKRSLFDKLIMHILISEMIDQINILLSIISDSFGGLNFENVHSKMLVCFSQIFIAIFSCLWTLTASFFISLKLYEKLSGETVRRPSSNPFMDTDDDEILRAYKIGITNGTSETTFSPDDLITREQMATMMARAIGACGVDVEITSENRGKGFADESAISYWAISPVLFMSMHDILNGMGNGLFTPLANATIEQSILVSLRAYNSFKK